LQSNDANYLIKIEDTINIIIS